MCVDQETRTIYVFGGQSLMNPAIDGSPIAAAAAAAAGNKTKSRGLLQLTSQYIMLKCCHLLMGPNLL